MDKEKDSQETKSEALYNAHLNKTCDLKKTYECSVCEKASRYYELSFGSLSVKDTVDLDTRGGNEVILNVKRCPYCGFCNIDISNPIKGSKQIVYSEVYKRNLTCREYPLLANSYRCLSQLAENTGDYFLAFVSTLHAAWVCDDYHHNFGSSALRKDALFLLSKVEEEKFEKREYHCDNVKDIEILKEKVNYWLLWIDLYRRIAWFDKASDVCSYLKLLLFLITGLMETPWKILRFQQFLINNLDATCHNLQEAHNWWHEYNMAEDKLSLNYFKNRKKIESSSNINSQHWCEESNGETIENAVVINARNNIEGIMAEYAFIEKHCGEEGKNWGKDMQSTHIGDDGKYYDMIRIEMKDGSTRDFYFDITSFFGKLSISENNKY